MFLASKALLGELGHGEGAVLLRAAGGERGEADDEEVEAGEGDHVDGELAEVAVELAREAEGAGGARHGGGDEVVEVTVGRGGELEGAEADVVQGLVVEAKHSSEFSTSWWTERVALYGSTTVSDTLGDGHDRVGAHDAVGVLLADLGDRGGCPCRSRCRHRASG